MPQSHVCCHLHFVFSTKNRTPLITPDVETRLYEYVGGILREMKCVLTSAGGMPDHVHLLVSMGRETSFAELMRVVKTNSSKWIHETFPGLRDFAWQSGYGGFSVSHSNRDQVKAYIGNQKEHHRKLTFQEEVRALLTKHEIEFDERYVWD